MSTCHTLGARGVRRTCHRGKADPRHLRVTEGSSSHKRPCANLPSGDVASLGAPHERRLRCDARTCHPGGEQPRARHERRRVPWALLGRHGAWVAQTHRRLSASAQARQRWRVLRGVLRNLPHEGRACTQQSNAQSNTGRRWQGAARACARRRLAQQRVRMGEWVTRAHRRLSAVVQALEAEGGLEDEQLRGLVHLPYQAGAWVPVNALMHEWVPFWHWCMLGG